MFQKQPYFSIIIPTYNRAERLTHCLRAITQLDYPHDRFEVIVVDDGSSIPMDAVIQSFKDELNLVLICQSNSGPATARNTGAARATGQFLVFTDDDCTPARDWLSRLADRFAIEPNCLIGGQTLNALSHNIFSTASQLLIDYLYTYYNNEQNQASFFASNNLALPKEEFHHLGGFDTSFPLAAGEDRELCDRWLYHHYKMVYAPEVQVYHAHHLTLPKFWRQHFNYGCGAFCFHQVRAQRECQQIQVEPLSFYFNLLTYPFQQRSTQSAPVLSGLLFLSQVANVAGFFWQRKKQSV